MKTADWLVRLFIKNPGRVHDERVRASYGCLEAWTSIIGNLLLFALKLALGLLINSIALIAESFHTLSDIVTSVVVLLGFRLAKAPPDKEHPFGHGRMETIATLIISLLLFFTGYELLQAAWDRFIKVPAVGGDWLVVAVLIGSVLAKEWMANFAVYLGRRINSDALLADAWHHRSDAFASGLVVAAVLGAIYGYYRLDPILGLAVSLLIIYTGLKIAVRAISQLLGETPRAEFLARIGALARDIPGVREVHEIFVHSYGSHQVISLHIIVDPDQSLARAHQIADQVEKKIGADLKAQAVVHIDLPDSS